MSSAVTARQFKDLLANIQPGPDRSSRALAIFAGSIVTGDQTVMSGVISDLRGLSVPRVDLYETILQSYLFLGFPRMLVAAECLASEWPELVAAHAPSNDEDLVLWKNRGTNLYNQVYGKNAERLKDRVMSFAPEIFDWMITEGYGKVLSRPGLDLVRRERAIVAFLTVDNRPKQLLSHLKGALLVGATRDQLQTTLDDLTTIAPDGVAVARGLLAQIGVAK